MDFTVNKSNPGQAPAMLRELADGLESGELVLYDGFLSVEDASSDRVLNIQGDLILAKKCHLDPHL